MRRCGTASSQSTWRTIGKLAHILHSQGCADLPPECAAVGRADRRYAARLRAPPPRRSCSGVATRRRSAPPWRYGSVRPNPKCSSDSLVCTVGCGVTASPAPPGLVGKRNARIISAPSRALASTTREYFAEATNTAFDAATSLDSDTYRLTEKVGFDSVSNKPKASSAQLIHARR